MLCRTISQREGGKEGVVSATRGASKDRGERDEIN